MTADPMRVQLVDPSAFTPPYDRALAAALARAGAEVELLDQPLPLRPGARGRGLPGRGALLPAQRRARPRRPRPPRLQARRAPARHAAPPRATLDADVVHYQWLTRARPRRAAAAAAPPAGDDRPLHPAAAAQPPPGRRAPAAPSAAWTPSSPTPSTAPRRLRDEVGLDPAGSGSSRTAPSTT